MVEYRHDKQITLSAIADELSQARTRKKEILEQMNELVPWGEWERIISPYYYKGECGSKPYDLERMIRIHVLQSLYELLDTGVMGEVIDSRAFSEFCGEDSSNQVPDGDTIGRFRALLVKHGLQEKLFAQVVEMLEMRELLLTKGQHRGFDDHCHFELHKKSGAQARPEAHQTKKGNAWNLGYKTHIGVDKDIGLCII